MTPFLAFMLWLFALWVVASLTHRALRPTELVDDLDQVNLTVRQIRESEYRWSLDQWSDVVRRAERMRPYRQKIRRRA